MHNRPVCVLLGLTRGQPVPVRRMPVLLQPATTLQANGWNAINRIVFWLEVKLAGLGIRL